MIPITPDGKARTKPGFRMFLVDGRVQHGCARSWQVLLGATVMHNLHLAADCEQRGRCAVHNATDHRMVTWPLLWDADNQMLYRWCDCGNLHPDPDDACYQKEVAEWNLHHPRCAHCTRDCDENDPLR